MQVTSTVEAIRNATTPLDLSQTTRETQEYINNEFGDLDVLLGHAGPSTPRTEHGGRGKRKRRTLKEDIVHWDERAEVSLKELNQTSEALPKLLHETQDKLQLFLSSAQSLSLERYTLADKLATLVSELSSSTSDDEPEFPDGNQRKSVLEQMEGLQAELGRLDAALSWVDVLERVLSLSEKTLSPHSHRPSPLAALPHYGALNDIVSALEDGLPADMSLLKVIKEIRDQTWDSLKGIMFQNLLNASEPLQWPMRVQYAEVPIAARRSFERTYQDVLFFQAEGERIHNSSGRPPTWSSGEGLYPLQALIQPIALRFKYHFQGTKNTNRVDKPEWAFSNILDRIYEHQSFIEEYLQPLTERSGYRNVDVRSEFTMLLFPILLNLLRARIPKLLDHPALLAHIIYQTVIFDDAIREGGFDVKSVSVSDGRETASWEGLAGVLLSEEGWFDQWLAGEKKFADTQLNSIISASDAWDISDETTSDEDGSIDPNLKPTVSVRQVKSLVEQIIDRYSPLPALEYKLPFLTSIQLPTLSTYHHRISGSLDAFETLSSAFVRAVPGALSGNTRSGVHIDQTKVTSGTAGLDRLMKALLSSTWMLSALRGWADDLFFVEISTDLREAPQLRWRIASDNLIPITIRSGLSHDTGAAVSIFDVVIQMYETLCERAEEMIVKLITVEVEGDLKQHLQRRWDRTAGDDISQGPDNSLLNAITTLSAHLSSLNTTLPPITLSRLYRRIIHHLSNHIQQRAVYSGWSKFSEQGGKDLSEEITDWKSACSASLGNLPGGDAAINAPWTRLSDIARIVSLPSELNQHVPSFSQAMASAWDGDDSFVSLSERLGLVDMGRGDLQAIMRRRVDCWR